MPDYLMYWKYFWEDIEENLDSLNDYWHTKNEHFFEQVKQGDSLWVIVSGGLHCPDEWRLLQRIVVQEKFANYKNDRPYGIAGDPKKGQKFNVETQSDLTNLLHKLQFVSGRKITVNGRAIGNALQAIRPLTESDTLLLEQYANNLERHRSDAGFNNALEETFPEEIVNAQAYYEGATKQVTVNIYERNTKARKACIAYYGLDCFICSFNFKSVYGEVGNDFIHVHHLKPLFEIGEEYVLDPIKDLRPVCPNCHAIIHKRIPAYSIKEMKKLLKQNAD